MNVGDTVQAIVVKTLEDELEVSVLWEGKVPHDNDYYNLHSLGSELGFEILEAIAGQKPWEILTINIVKKVGGCR